MESRSRNALPHVLLLAVTILASGCDDTEPKRREAAAESSRHSAAHSEPWLQPNSQLSPAQWLASRGLKDAKAIDDPDVKRIADVLGRANRLYRESERMIANRTAQLEGMLKDIGVDEKATDILDDLTRVAGEAGQTEGFGAVSQHYFNLRSNKMERLEALAELRSRYGRRQ